MSIYRVDMELAEIGATMADPVYFIVERFHGREIGTIINHAPPQPKYVHHPIIATIRLDTMRNFQALMTLSTMQLLALWKAGELK